MSEIKVKVRPQTKIGACRDAESLRYALGAVQIIPREGGVYATATDGWCLSVVACDGQAIDGAHLLPGRLTKPKLESTLNGRWETTTPATRSKPAQVATAESPEGRFPRTADVMPSVSADEYGLGLAGFKMASPSRGFQVLTIDPALLAKIGEALNNRDEVHGLTLLVPIQDDPTGKAVEQAIPVIGQHGIGVLMPLAGRGMDDVLAYESIRADYAAREQAARS